MTATNQTGYKKETVTTKEATKDGSTRNNKKMGSDATIADGPDGSDISHDERSHYTTSARSLAAKLTDSSLGRRNSVLTIVCRGLKQSSRYYYA